MIDFFFFLLKFFMQKSIQGLGHAKSQFVVSQALALGNWQLYKKVKYHVTTNLYGFLVMNIIMTKINK